MPVLSFQGEWLDKLLASSKQQTTRQQTDRIKVGDVCHIYNQQRRRISSKPLIPTTRSGRELIYRKIEYEGTYPRPDSPGVSGIDGRGNVWYSLARYYAHFLGKVVITEVYDILPSGNMTNEKLEKWAQADGFKAFDYADEWFSDRYSINWTQQTWTVIRWQDWLERYFEPEVI